MTKNSIPNASAGSGKAYRLSNEFPKILFNAPPDFMPLDEILASAFT